ncbi:MAG: hypothetical protein ACREB9_07500, partial [Thermoplasmata archaeon]
MNTDTVPFTVEASWSFTPTTGTLPQTLTATGTGFPASQASPTIAASNPGSVTFTLGACSTDPSGDLSCSINVTSAPTSPQTFTADSVVSSSSFTASTPGPTITGAFSASCGVTCPSTLTASDPPSIPEGDILVVVLTTYGETSGPFTPSDLSDNLGTSTWTLLGSPLSWDGNYRDSTYVFYSDETTLAPATGTVSIDLSSVNPSDASFTFIGVAGASTTHPIDAYTQNAGSGTSSSATVTTSQPNDLLVGFVGTTEEAAPISPTSGAWTSSEQTSTSVDTYLEYQSVSDIGVYTSSPSWSLTANYAAWLLAIEPPAASLSPSSAVSGTSVTASVSGFSTADTSIAVTGPGDIALCTISPTGGAGSCQFTANAANGFSFSAGGTSNEVLATGDTYADVASATFIGTQVSIASFSPTTGPVGTTVTVTGTGFAASTPIIFSFDGSSVATTCATDGTGAFPGTTGDPCT